jgi:hypothetical protein
VCSSASLASCCTMEGVQYSIPRVQYQSEVIDIGVVCMHSEFCATSPHAYTSVTTTLLKI